MISLLREKYAFRRREAIAYFYDLLKRASAEQVRVVIFAQGRSGSTLLESLLCSTGYFTKHGELLNNDRGDKEIMFPERYISGLAKWESDSNFIFHVKIYQLTRDRRRSVDPGLFLECLSRKGYKVIALYRKNVVLHALSNIVAEQRGSYEKLDDSTEKLQVRIDCNSFPDKVRERVRFRKAEQDVLSNIDYHEIVYEDDLEHSGSHQGAVDGILEYLSLERRQVTTEHRKVNTTPLVDLIANYHEFVECMNACGFDEYIQGR